MSELQVWIGLATVAWGLAVIGLILFWNGRA